MTLRRGSETAAREPGRDWWGPALFVLGVVLPLFRQTGTHSWRTIWAEDGSIYFQQAYSHGGLAVLLRGYAGYLQLPPRLLGAIAAFVPIRQLALYFAVSAQLVDALLAWFVYWASDGWLTSRPARLALAALVVLMPALGRENTATITNTIWTFAAVAPWALVARAERPRAVALRGVVAFLAATATALAVALVPFAIGCALVRRTVATRAVVSAFCLGLVLQVGVILHTKDDRKTFVGPVRHASRFPELVSVRVFAQYLLADKGIAAFWYDRRVVAVMAPIVVLAIFGARLRGASLKNQLLAAGFVALAIVSFVVPVWVRGTQSVGLTPSEANVLAGGGGSTAYVSANRFSVVPVMALASAAGLLLAGSRRRNARTATPVWPAVFAGHLVLLMIVGFSVANLRSYSPSWAPTVDRAYRRECIGERPATMITVRTTVAFPFPVTLRCGDLAP